MCIELTSVQQQHQQGMHLFEHEKYTKEIKKKKESKKTFHGKGTGDSSLYQIKITFC